MDIQIQGDIDGVETADRIRERFDVPVVYLTAFADEKTLQRAKTTDAFAFVLTPFKNRELYGAIEFALYHHQTARQLQQVHDELERRVEERTAELAQCNDELHREIAERQRAVEAQALLTEQLRQSQKMEALGVLASGIAHDFNNMLTIITGYSYLLISHMGDENPLINEVQGIKQGSDRAALTSQLSTFGRRQGLQHSTVDLNAAVEHARDAMSEGGHWRIETAVLALDRPLANHFVDFAPGEYVRLRVADSGKGTGLGLSTVYSLVDQSNCQIDVTSRATESTAFDLYFPFTDTRPAEAAVAQASPTVGEDIDQSGEIILLVEDDDVVHNLARRVLGDHGYSVVEAQHGEEALAMSELHKGPIHLLLTDVAMPEMSGSQLAQNFEWLRPDIPVLYMSGYTDDTALRYAVQENEVALLQKPFTPDALVAKVREVIGG